MVDLAVGFPDGIEGEVEAGRTSHH
jgi:hypothetical protein